MDLNRLYYSAATALYYNQRYEQALTVADKLDDTLAKAQVYQMVARGFASRKETGRALELFNAALTMLEDVPKSDEKMYVMSSILYSMIYADFIDEAVDVLDSMDDEEDKAYLKALIKTQSNFDLSAWGERNWESATSYVTFKQDSEGTWWFIGMYSNKFKDRQGEILSSDAHQRYVKWVNDNGVRPQVILHHQPRLKSGLWGEILERVDDGRISVKALNRFMRKMYASTSLAETERVFYSNGFVGVIARVHEGREKWVERLQAYDKPVGMSHGFVPVVIDGNIYEDYRSFEFTVLPQQRAANQWTSVLFLEDGPMDEETRNFLNEIKEGAAEEIERQAQEAEEDLETAGVSFKDADDVVDAIVERLKFRPFMEKLNGILDEFSTSIKEIDARLKSVEQSQDEKIAALYDSPRFRTVSRPTDADGDPEHDPEKEKADKPFDFMSHLGLPL